MTPGEADDWFAERMGSTMAILRGLGTARTLQLATSAWDLGIRLVEVPVQSNGDLQTLKAVVAASEARGLETGAGTVTNLELLDRVRDAGARFIVSPGYAPDVSAAALRDGLPSLDGVATPTEIQAVMATGRRWMKAFPASVLEPSWFRAMRGPFPDARLVATGGMDADVAPEYLAAGAAAVAVGSALEDDRQLALLAHLTGSSE